MIHALAPLAPYLRDVLDELYAAMVRGQGDRAHAIVRAEVALAQAEEALRAAPRFRVESRLRLADEEQVLPDDATVTRADLFRFGVFRGDQRLVTFGSPMAWYDDQADAEADCARRNAADVAGWSS